MKATVCLFAALVSASSFAVEIHALPRSEFADTEVSTNFAFSVGGGSSRRLAFSLELQGAGAESARRIPTRSHRDQGSRPLLIGNSEDAYTQTFKILPSGESSVEKFGYRLTRSRWSFSGEVIKIQ